MLMMLLRAISPMFIQRKKKNKDCFFDTNIRIFNREPIFTKNGTTDRGKNEPKEGCC